MGTYVAVTLEPASSVIAGVNMHTTGSNIDFPSTALSLITTPFATRTSRQAAHSVADPVLETVV